MLLPHGAHFLRGGQLTTRNFGFGLGQIGIFVCSQLDRRLIDASELQQNARKFVLLCIGQGRNLAKGLFEQSGHTQKIPQQKGPGKTGALELVGPQKTDQRE